MLFIFIPQFKSSEVRLFGLTPAGESLVPYDQAGDTKKVLLPTMNKGRSALYQKRNLLLGGDILPIFGIGMPLESEE